MNDFILETTDRLIAVSSKMRDYMDDELYVRDIENAEEHTLDSIFPILLRMCIEELSELGIELSIDLTDIYEDVKKIKALVTLREMWDATLLSQALAKKYQTKERLTSILDSIDYTQGELLYTCVDVLAHDTPDLVPTLQDVYYLETSAYSTASFKKHVEAILDEIVPTSTTSDVAIQAFGIVAKALVEIKKDLTTLDKYYLSRGLITEEEYEAQQAYIPNYTRRLADPKYAEGYAWMLSRPLDATTWSEEEIDKWMTLSKQHRHETPGYFQYFRYRSSLTRTEAIFAIKLGVLDTLSLSHEGMSSYKWLLTTTTSSSNRVKEAAMMEQLWSIQKYLSQKDLTLCQSLIDASEGL